jgi:hypothetical protein
MDGDDALRRYRENRFTDEDVTRCTGLSVRGWRELIKHKAVRTVTEHRGPGRVRLCDATVLKRAAVISALNQAGLSIAVAGRVAYFLPFHTLLYSVCDPGTVLLSHSAEVDPKTGLPPRVERPLVGWFNPLKPAMADRETDWLIEIYDGRYVAAVHNCNVKDESTIFGDLRKEGTHFVAWFPHRRRGRFTGGAIGEIAHELLPYHRFIDFVAESEDPIKWAKELTLLNYEFEKHDTDADPLCVAADATAASPVFKTTINVTLAIRKALRRYLGIEPAAPLFEMGESR